MRRRWAGRFMVRVAPTIPVATTRGGDPQLVISDDDWRRIEAAYGRPLPAEVREQIRDATLSFLMFVEGEQAAQPVSVARAHVERVKKAAAKLCHVVVENPQDSAWDARNYANRLIGQNFNDAGKSVRDLPRWLGTLMVSLGAACNHALTQLDDPGRQGRRKGDTWENWARKLAAILAANGLPTQVRKDTDKNIHRKPSPFVHFIRELQSCVPEESRRGTHSDNALSEAISRAQGHGRVTKPHRSVRNKTRQPPNSSD
jgi:hypothetical protein